MKTQQISLTAFHNKVKELAEKAGRSVSVVDAQIGEYSGNTILWTFRCYVDGFDFYSGATPNEAIAKLKLAMFPPKQSISDVVVEVEGGEV